MKNRFLENLNAFLLGLNSNKKRRVFLFKSSTGQIDLIREDPLQFFLRTWQTLISYNILFILLGGEVGKQWKTKKNCVDM